MKLVIVESPTKAKTISKFLGKEFIVESSFGHVRDLPKSKLGVDLENNFEPQYIIPTKAKKNITKLKKEAKEADEVILATDEDREGEAIAWHLAQALDLEKLKKKTERIVFHEITKSAIQNALTNPGKIDYNRVDAQQARRVLDRLVGYKLSPFLWKKVVKGLSAGRVQSVALRLIVERENEIRAFKSQEYWTIVAELLNKKSELLETNLVKIGGETVEKLDIPSQIEAEKISEDLKNSTFTVTRLEEKELRKNPLPPFITSTLQQDAAKRLGFSAKKTMVIAQHLYENGHITYMRTDSVNLSKESVLAAKDWLEKNLGAQYAEQAPRVFTAKAKLAQEAHEAIRPSDVFQAPETISLADAGEQKLYKLIWQRFVASQMPQAIVSGRIIDVSAQGKKEYTLRATGQKIIFDGYLKVWPQKLAERELPDIAKGENLDLKEIKPSQHFTEPPPRFSEATLIKALEEDGIGRPSTYAPIISVLMFRNYVTKDKGRFVPSEIGEMVTKVLVEHFPNIVDIGFTAKTEEGLDRIAAGEEKWQEFIKNFYEPFAKNLAEKYEAVKKTIPDEPTNEICEKCGKPMIIKYGRFGKFMACSGFPDCKNTKKIAKEPPKTIGLKCPKCLEDAERKADPGDIIERRVSKGRARGKIFWGCSKYPKCDYASWENPLGPAKEKDETPKEVSEE